MIRTDVCESVASNLQDALKGWAGDCSCFDKTVDKLLDEKALERFTAAIEKGMVHAKRHHFDTLSTVASVIVRVQQVIDPTISSWDSDRLLDLERIKAVEAGFKRCAQKKSPIEGIGSSRDVVANELISFFYNLAH